MDDATKFAAAAAPRIDQDPKSTSAHSKEAFVAYMDDSAEKPQGEKSPDGANLTTSARALDRWFKERQKTQGA